MEPGLFSTGKVLFHLLQLKDEMITFFEIENNDEFVHLLKDVISSLNLLTYLKFLQY